MADPISREVLEATAHILQACCRDPLLLAMAALFLSSLALVDIFISVAGFALLAVSAAASTDDYLVLLSFYILVFLNFAAFLFSVLLICFSIAVSAGLPCSSSPPVAAENLLASNALTVSKFYLCFSTVLLFILLVYSQIPDI